MFSVVEFTDLSVSVVHQAWFNEAGQVYFPEVWNNRRTRMLLSGTAPPITAKYHDCVKHKSTDDYALACRWEEMLAEMNCIVSSDATTPMKDAAKRVRKPTVYEGYQMEPSTSQSLPPYRVEVEYDPPPPKKLLRLFSEPPSIGELVCGPLPLKDTLNASRISPACDTPPILQVESHKSDSEHIIGLLEKLTLIAQQNVQEVRALRKEVATMGSRISIPSPESFRLRLPVCSLEDMDILEDQLAEDAMYSKLVEYLSTAGGINGNSMIWSVLGMILSISIADKISWRIKKNKRCIAHTAWVRAAVECTMAKKFPLVTRSYLHRRIQAWIAKKAAQHRRFLKQQGGL